MTVKSNPLKSDAPLPASTRLAGLYSFLLLACYNIAAAGLIAVPVQFILKNDLHLEPTQVASFSFLTDIPVFFGFVFGFVRDRWRPFGRGDRGYLGIVPILMALVYVFLMRMPHTYGILAAGLMMLAVLSCLIGAAAQGIVAAIAKDFGMMGRLSVISLITFRGSNVYQQAVGGMLGEHSSPAAPYLVSAVVCLSIIAFAFWRPSSLFRSGDEVFIAVIPENTVAAFHRLLRHRALFIPATVMFLWEFAPGWGTPLFFHLTNTVKLSEGSYGEAMGWLRLGQVLSALPYGYLCMRFRFKALLNTGTFLGTVGAAIFLLIHQAGQAIPVCFIAGAMCGLALASYNDLLFRCCPKELEGVALMVTMAAFGLAGDSSDIFGSYLYEHGGFALALFTSMLFTAFIFIPIAFLPQTLARPREGEPIVDPDPPKNVDLSNA